MYKVSAVYTPPSAANMRFDHEHYLSVHVPMMNQMLPGRVPFVRVDLETGVQTLVRTAVSDAGASSAKPPQQEVVSPLVANIYFANRDDALAFADFVTGDAAAELHADVPKFTNCDIHWTVSEMSEPAS